MQSSLEMQGVTWARLEGPSEGNLTYYQVLAEGEKLSG